MKDCFLLSFKKKSFINYPTNGALTKYAFVFIILLLLAFNTIGFTAMVSLKNSNHPRNTMINLDIRKFKYEGEQCQIMMKYVGAGSFNMGSNNDGKNAKPIQIDLTLGLISMFMIIINMSNTFLETVKIISPVPNSL